MRGLPSNAQGKWAFEAVDERLAVEIGKGAAFLGGRRQKGVIQEKVEPRSVLDHWSPSPQTSTSTLSSSLSGGAETAGGVAVPKGPTLGWPYSDSVVTDGGGRGGTRKEWAASVPPPVPAGLNMGYVIGGEKCSLGADEWEAMLSGAPAASLGQEQTFFRWIMGDVDDPSAASFKQQQLLSQIPPGLDGNNGGLGFGVLNTGFGLEAIGGTGVATSAAVSVVTPPLGSTPASFNIKDATFGPQADSLLFSPSQLQPSLSMNNVQQPESLPTGMLFHAAMEEKSYLFDLGNPPRPPPPPPLHAASDSFFFPLPAAQQEHLLPQLLPPQLKLHHSLVGQLPAKLGFANSGGAGGPDPFSRQNQAHHQENQSFANSQARLPQQNSVKTKVAGFGGETTTSIAAAKQQALVDQLFEAAKMIETGNSVSARVILARLNQQLPSPLGQPLLRTAFYFKEALQLLVAKVSGEPAALSLNHQARSLLDVVLKLDAYKAFSEVSPILQFTNFTCIQAVLEELGGCDCIHIVDFDIGIGGQWSSLMQELAQRRGTAAGSFPMLKITAFVLSSSHHPLELHLTRDNLSHFASELNIPFQFNVLSLDSFDPSDLLSMRGEAIAVSLPVGSTQNLPFPTLLRLIKQLSPKIVVSIDQCCVRSDLPFSHHFLQAFQSSMVLLDSIDAAGTSQDVASKIERFLLQPRIENAVLSHHRAVDKVLPWQTLFASAGFTPLQFSNFTETQAECLLKRVQVRGFHVEKRQASLFLHWQRGELVSVSAWRC